MTSMKQPKTDYGERSGETGEREPKRAGREDERGESRKAVPKADREKFQPGETGESDTKGAKSRDSSGERKERMVGGVGMGKADGIGARPGGHMGKQDGKLGEMNDGNKGEREVYRHKRG